MLLKSPDRMRNEWWQLSPYLRRVICDADVWCLENGERDGVWTSFIRTEEEQAALFDAGLTKSKVDEHMLGRGADHRMLSTKEKTQAMCDYINAKYLYDPRRPLMKTMSIHGGTALHVHTKVLT